MSEEMPEKMSEKKGLILGLLGFWDLVFTKTYHWVTLKSCQKTGNIVGLIKSVPYVYSCTYKMTSLSSLPSD